MLGHPLHPAIVHFPIGLLLSATIVDVAWVAGLSSDPRLAAVLMAGGLVMALVAMGAGLVDFARLDQAVVPHAVRHMAAVGTAWLGYGIALYLRREVLTGGTALGTASLALSMASAAVLALGGWLGGRLVYTFGAGVSPDARR
ncbi:MAG TPA: DUF2231 domain-containing protein [Sphingomicrobium sp.]|jgi:uncharacterized membrane protein|nr:DUF2231 domain-containing protein [Sphingomicrobium sp.]